MKSISENQLIAIQGYDPVCFFKGRAERGQQQFKYSYADLIWLFSNAENRATFIINPQTYMPQFAGHCALAVSLGQKTPGKPRAWSIIDNKLYFSGNRFANRLFKWIPGRKEAAHEKWPALQ